MTSIPLGRVTVAVAGTPVALLSAMTAAQKAALAPNQQCYKIEVFPDPASTGKVYVKQAGVTLAALPVPVNSVPLPWTAEADRNNINITAYSLDAATGGDGAFCTVWVR